MVRKLWNWYYPLSSRKAAGQRTTSDSTSSFRRSLLDAILDVLRVTPCAVSSGAVQWLFKLLTGFAAQADSTLTSFVCLELLELLSSKLATARLREHLFLRARLERLLLLLLSKQELKVWACVYLCHQFLIFVLPPFTGHSFESTSWGKISVAFGKCHCSIRQISDSIV